MIEAKKVEIGGKTFLINKAPATVAYEVALRYQELGKDPKGGVDSQMVCLNKLLKYVDVDLGDGRKMALDSESVVNQHITNVEDLVKLQTSIMEVNFGFFLKGNHSDS